MVYKLKEEGFKLKYILLVVGIPESTYHYHVKQLKKLNSNQRLKEQIEQLFFQFKERFGYKRITNELKKLGYSINHKKVYRLMKEMGLKCVKFMRKSRKYNSYKGKVGTIAKNKLNRRFSTPITLQKLVTDVTEFKCTGEENLYLSPILDLCNSEVRAYGINKRPIPDLVMKPLKEAIGVLKQEMYHREKLVSYE